MERERILQGDACQQLLIERTEQTGWITFNDPARHNAVSFDMWVGISAALEAFEKDPDIRSVVLTGAGDKSFISGANISQFGALRSSREAVDEYERVSERAQVGLRQFPKPTIARINGYCIGGGAGIALCCDIRIASENATFAIPAARLGLGYRFSALQTLVRVVGAANALEIMLTASKMSAAEAKERGMVNVVVGVNALDATVDGYLTKINANAPLTMRASKHMIDLLASQAADIDIEAMKEMVRKCYASEDYQEGKTAFAEKRPPRFVGR